MTSMSALQEDEEVSKRITQLWYTRCPVPTVSGIAQHHRWLHREFEAVGVQLASVRASGDASVRVSHFDHSQAGMFREGGNVPPLWARARGAETALIGITWVDEEQFVLVRPDSPIRSAPDLRGRTLGLPTNRGEIVDISRAEHLRGLLNGLALGGLTAADATFVDLGAGGLDLRENEARIGRPLHPGLAPLLACEIDAIYAKGAAATTLIAEHGLRPILNINAQPDRGLKVNAGTPRPITVNRALALEQPDLVARYLAVLLRTAAWATRHPDEVVAAVAAETGATDRRVRDAYGPNLHERFEPRLSDEYVAAIADQQTFLLRNGIIESTVDVPNWILPGPLAAARDLKLNFEI